MSYQSLEFVLFCAVTLLSITSIIGIVPGMINQFSRFDVLNFVKFLIGVGCDLIAPAILVALYLNRKKDCREKVALVLTISGVLKLLSVAFSFVSASGLVNPFASNVSQEFIFEIVQYCAFTMRLLLGVLMLLASSSIKKEKTSGSVQGLAFFAIFISVFLVLANLIVPGLAGMPNISYAVVAVSTALGLWCLPKTVYDYDQCFFFGKAAVALIAFIVVVVVFVMAVGGSITSNDDKRGNCFNCNGTGYDSANHGSCVWCGGDGYSSWNP